MNIEAPIGFRNELNGITDFFRRAFGGGAVANRVQESDDPALWTDSFAFVRKQMDDGANDVSAVGAGTAGGSEPYRARRPRFLRTIARTAPVFVGVAAVLIGVDALAGTGNAISDMLDDVVTGATVCGVGIASVGAVGAMGALSTGNNGIVGPCMKATGGGVGIASASELIGIATGGATGATLSMPYAMSAGEWFHLLARLVA